jgi:serine/threonine protein kinase
MSVAHTVAMLAGRYRLDQPMAPGGCGEVWRGTDVFLARPIAIKLLRPELAADAETLARFRDSARRTGSLVHGGIARIYDYIESGSGHAPFLVMEFVDGLSLADVVADGPLDPARVMDVVAQAADALDAAHWAGLMHGGIKPANVLLSRDGVVKLTDFGIAAGSGPASVTGSGALAGDLGYFAPKRVKRACGSAAGDLYSLGVVAYQCLTGGLPPGGVPARVALVGRDDPAPALPADVPAEVAALIGQLTAGDPASRLSDAGEVASRAGELRDRMIADDTGQPGGAPAVPPVAQASQQASGAPTVPWRWDNRKRRGAVCCWPPQRSGQPPPLSCSPV